MLIFFNKYVWIDKNRVNILWILVLRICGCIIYISSVEVYLYKYEMIKLLKWCWNIMIEI